MKLKIILINGIIIFLSKDTTFYNRFPFKKNHKQTTFKQDFLNAVWSYCANTLSLLPNFSELYRNAML